VERRTRVWIGLGTALLVGSSTSTATLGRQVPALENTSKPASVSLETRPRTLVAQAEASGEGGPGEGGGAVLGTITEFRLSSNLPDAFAYDASSQVKAYAALVHNSYVAAHGAATGLRDAVEALKTSPSDEALEAARDAWGTARNAYLRTEAFQFYAGPVDGPGGPLPRLNGWPVDTALVDGLINDANQSLNFRAIARLNVVEPTPRYTTGLHVIEYLLWGTDGDLTRETGARRLDYLDAVAQLLVNDLGVLVAAWQPGTNNNYRASVEAMDQRNALGRAFNGMTVLLGYEIPLRRIGAGLFPANENFQPSPFSDSSSEDGIAAFEGAQAVYFTSGLYALIQTSDPAIAEKIATGFDRAEKALAAMDAPYARFLAPASGSPERKIADEAVRALTDLARDIRQGANGLGVLVVVPGM
jgi:putative iron-regulated protein